MFALELKNEALHSRALQALCSVYIGNPRLILLTDQEGIVEWIFSSNFTAIVHEKFLGALRRMVSICVYHDDKNRVFVIDPDFTLFCFHRCWLKRKDWKMLPL